MEYSFAPSAALQPHQQQSRVRMENKCLKGLMAAAVTAGGAQCAGVLQAAQIKSADPLGEICILRITENGFKWWHVRRHSSSSSHASCVRGHVKGKMTFKRWSPWEVLRSSEMLLLRGIKAKVALTGPNWFSWEPVGNSWASIPGFLSWHVGTRTYRRSCPCVLFAMLSPKLKLNLQRAMSQKELFLSNKVMEPQVFHYSNKRCVITSMVVPTHN